mgnify:CR=1 FL=1
MKKEIARLMTKARNGGKMKAKTGVEFKMGRQWICGWEAAEGRKGIRWMR